MSAISDDLTSAILNRMSALSLSIGGQDVTVMRRKVLEYDEAIDGALPVLIVACSGKPESTTPFSIDAQGTRYDAVVYRVNLGLFAAGNRDGVSNESDLHLARQKMRKALENKGADLPDNTLRISPAPDSPILEPQAWPENYDVSAMSGTVTIAEKTGN